MNFAGLPSIMQGNRNNARILTADDQRAFDAHIREVNDLQGRGFGRQLNEAAFRLDRAWQEAVNKEQELLQNYKNLVASEMAQFNSSMELHFKKIRMLLAENIRLQFTDESEAAKFAAMGARLEGEGIEVPLEGEEERKRQLEQRILAKIEGQYEEYVRRFSQQLEAEKEKIERKRAAAQKIAEENNKPPSASANVGTNSGANSDGNNANAEQKWSVADLEAALVQDPDDVFAVFRDPSKAIQIAANAARLGFRMRAYHIKKTSQCGLKFDAVPPKRNEPQMPADSSRNVELSNMMVARANELASNSNGIKTEYYQRNQEYGVLLRFQCRNKCGCGRKCKYSTNLCVNCCDGGHRH